jgi:DnaJ-class molecular chaperone
VNVRAAHADIAAPLPAENFRQDIVHAREVGEAGIARIGAGSPGIGEVTLTLPDGSLLDVTIPPGTRDGQVLRLRGKGRPGIGGGPAGDVLIEVEVRPHRVFTRKGADIHVELPISLSEAVLGGKVKVPTPSGEVTMTIPKWSNTGTVLRLKGQGVPRPGGTRGDEYVTLKVMLPIKPDPELEKFIAQWRPTTARNPREAMGA